MDTQKMQKFMSTNNLSQIILNADGTYETKPVKKEKDNSSVENIATIATEGLESWAVTATVTEGLEASFLGSFLDDLIS